MRFDCKSGDGAFLNVVTQLRHNVGVLLHIDAENNHAEADAILADPATADAIASALHVAAAQVRIARGEAAPSLSYDARIILNRVDGRDLDVEDVRRIARDLNAWLAAHEVDAIADLRGKVNDRG